MADIDLVRLSRDVKAEEETRINGRLCKAATNLNRGQDALSVDGELWGSSPQPTGVGDFTVKTIRPQPSPQKNGLVKFVVAVQAENGDINIFVGGDRKKEKLIRTIKAEEYSNQGIKGLNIFSTGKKKNDWTVYFQLETPANIPLFPDVEEVENDFAFDIWSHHLTPSSEEKMSYFSGKNYVQNTENITSYELDVQNRLFGENHIGNGASGNFYYPSKTGYIENTRNARRTNNYYLTGNGQFELAGQSIASEALEIDALRNAQGTFSSSLTLEHEYLDKNGLNKIGAFSSTFTGTRLFPTNATISWTWLDYEYNSTDIWSINGFTYNAIQSESFKKNEDESEFESKMQFAFPYLISIKNDTLIYYEEKTDETPTTRIDELLYKWDNGEVLYHERRIYDNDDTEGIEVLIDTGLFGIDRDCVLDGNTFYWVNASDDKIYEEISEVEICEARWVNGKFRPKKYKRLMNGLSVNPNRDRVLAVHFSYHP